MNTMGTQTYHYGGLSMKRTPHRRHEPIVHAHAYHFKVLLTGTSSNSLGVLISKKRMSHLTTSYQQTLITTKGRRNIFLLFTLFAVYRMISTPPDVVFPFLCKWSSASGTSGGANPFGSERVGALTACARLSCLERRRLLHGSTFEATRVLYIAQVCQL
ncbi:hypothetical protein EI94DRAFT_810028 [Lactarius quietus]|nr:hypothetical protein EI94DRAFT_810028 [Lactarius quietus]